MCIIVYIIMFSPTWQINAFALSQWPDMIYLPPGGIL